MDVDSEEDLGRHRVYNPLYTPIPVRPVIIDQRNSYTGQPLLAQPLFAPILLPNEQSDVRDHCANERTFLSWLRMSMYLAVVSAAVVVSFHLKHEPTPAEKKAALPLGCVFWVLSLACLANGLANYLRTITMYSRRQAFVQSGWKTQVVFTIVAAAIIAACVFFLSTDAQSQQ